MAELEIELNLGAPMRKAMIEAGADLVDALPNYRFGIILELLKRDPISRCMIAEAIGERALLERGLDDRNQTAMDSGLMPEGSYTEKSWDDIALLVIADMCDTPGARGEVDAPTPIPHARGGATGGGTGC